MMAAASTSLGAFLCSRGSYERHECVGGLLRASSSEAFVKCGGLRVVATRPWRRLSSRSPSPAMALDAGKEVTGAGSDVDAQRWAVPQTIEEAIEQVADSLYNQLLQLFDALLQLFEVLSGLGQDEEECIQLNVSFGIWEGDLEWLLMCLECTKKQEYYSRGGPLLL